MSISQIKQTKSHAFARTGLGTKQGTVLLSGLKKKKKAFNAANLPGSGCKKVVYPCFRYANLLVTTKNYSCSSTRQSMAPQSRKPSLRRSGSDGAKSSIVSGHWRRARSKLTSSSH